MIRLFQSQQDTEQGGFANAGGAHQAVDTAGIQGEIQVLPYGHFPIGFRKAADYKLKRKHRRTPLSNSIRNSFSNKALTAMITMVQANRSAVLR
jgi:hypothetical protein